MIFHSSTALTPAPPPNKVGGAAWNDAHALGAGASVVIAFPEWYWTGAEAGVNYDFNVGALSNISPGVWEMPIDISAVSVVQGTELILSAELIFNPLRNAAPAGCQALVDVGIVDGNAKLRIYTIQSQSFGPPASALSFRALLIGFVVPIEP